MKKLLICSILIQLTFVLYGQPSFGVIERFLSKNCQHVLSAQEILQGLEYNEFLDEIKKLDKSQLTPEQRKKLFRVMILNEVRIAEHVYNDLIGMKYIEVCNVIYNSLELDQNRFNNETVFAGSGCMATLPFPAFHEMLKGIPLKKGQRVVDIGAGFGRLGIYLAIMHPGVQFIGYEIVPERVAEFNRVAKALELDAEIKVVEQDLSDSNFSLALADYYYSWAPVNLITGKKLWFDLAEKAKTHSFSYIFRGLLGGNPEDIGFIPTANFLWHSPLKAIELGLKKPQ